MIDMKDDPRVIELLRIWVRLRPCARVELLKVGQWLVESTFHGGPHDGLSLPIEWKDEIWCERPAEYLFDSGAVYVLSDCGRYKYAGVAQ